VEIKTNLEKFLRQDFRLGETKNLILYNEMNLGRFLHKDFCLGEKKLNFI
jgi:hypothetical protein